jgi:hypothetical protein
MTLLDEAKNIDSWNALINTLLDAPDWIQQTYNLTAQVVKYPVSNKWRPAMWQAMRLIPGPSRSASGYADVGQLDPFMGNDGIMIAMQEWMKPNLGGIIIDVEEERQGRQIDISENMIIMQASDQGMSRAYNTDNSAPHPRTWSLQGYLSQSMPWVDEGFLLRPSLVIQQAMLDAYAVSRRPIFYKSGLCPKPTKVLIEDYNINRVIEGTQGYKVSINLKEFIAYTVPFYKSGSNKQTSFETDPVIQKRAKPGNWFLGDPTPGDGSENV